MTKPALIPTDPVLIKEILLGSFENFHQRGFHLNEKNDPLMVNLAFTSGEKWKHLRTKLSPTFTRGKIKMMFPIVASHADRMTDYILPFVKNQEDIEMREIYASFTTEVIVSVAYGLDTNCFGNPKNEFRTNGTAFFEPTTIESIKTFIIIAFEKVADILGFTFISKDVTEFFTKVVKDSIRYRQENNIQRNDFLQLMLDIQKNDGGLSFSDINANCYIFFIAGFETSSGALTFCTYELALNPDIQERLRDEIRKVLEAHNGELSFDAIMEMKYMDMVLSETLRKYPIIDSLVRKSTKDFKIPNSDLVIPGGTLIMIPSIGFHHDEKYFENPNKFDPERFSEENVKKIQPFTYIPFGEGPRICVGMRFGQMQTKIGLVKLLTKYRLLTCSKTSIPMKYKPNAETQTPLDGMWLKLEEISA